MRVDEDQFLRFGVRLLGKRLRTLKKHLRHARRRPNAECVHQMRVASRRLRSVLALFAEALPNHQAEGWLQATRRFTRALGSVRDLDVQIEFINHYLEGPGRESQPGILRLRLRLQQKQRKTDARLRRALRKLIRDGTLRDIKETLHKTASSPRLESKRPIHLDPRAQAAIRRGWNELTTFEMSLKHPGQTKQHHQMRIAAKHLRYLLETLASVDPTSVRRALQAAIQIQSQLGEIHDCDVWIEALPRFLRKEKRRIFRFQGNTHGFRTLLPGINGLREDRAQNRRELFDKFVQYWQHTRNDGRWEKLLKLTGPTTKRRIL